LNDPGNCSPDRLSSAVRGWDSSIVFDSEKIRFLPGETPALRQDQRPLTVKLIVMVSFAPGTAYSKAGFPL